MVLPGQGKVLPVPGDGLVESSSEVVLRLPAEHRAGSLRRKHLIADLTDGGVENDGLDVLPAHPLSNHLDELEYGQR
jgi:hypothetical protein